MNAIKILIISATIGMAVLAAVIFVPGLIPAEDKKPAPAAETDKSETAATSTKDTAVAEPVPAGPVNLLAFGDLLLDRYIKRAIDNNDRDYPFANLKDFLAGHDLVLANLEGSFTDYDPKPLDPNNAFFTFDPKLAPLLKDYNFNILNLANNHVRDFGADGFSQSQAYLDAAGISHFGDYYNESGALVKDINGIKIAFLAYNEFGDDSVDGTVAKIKEAKLTADRVVVYTHWGIEYQTAFSALQQEKAHKLIDAGADVVLGSHPHVIQPIEIYNGKPIFYSLGNFLFDQIFSEEVTHGLAVNITFKENETDYELFVTEMNKMQVSLADTEKTKTILTKISQSSVASDEIKAGIVVGGFVFTRSE